jgi:hypothetical protein
MDVNTVEIYFMADEFGRKFDEVSEGHLPAENNGKRHGKRRFTMSDSEVMTVMILFRPKQFRNPKALYTQYIQVHCREDFPQTVGYNRFVELRQKTVVKRALLLQLCCLGRCSGISYMDSTPLRVYHMKRKHGHGTFRRTATKGKNGTGRFFGFKPHIVINDRGEIFDSIITQAHADDRESLKNRIFHKKLFGKTVADRGYISQDLFERLFVDGIHPITRLKRNMKNSLMSIRIKYTFANGRLQKRLMTNIKISPD